MAPIRRNISVRWTGEGENKRVSKVQRRQILHPLNSFLELGTEYRVQWPRGGRDPAYPAVIIDAPRRKCYTGYTVIQGK